MNLYLSVTDAEPKVTAEVLSDHWTEVVIHGRGGTFVLHLSAPDHADRLAIAIADAATAARCRWREQQEADRFAGDPVDDLDDDAFMAEMDEAF